MQVSYQENRCKLEVWNREYVFDGSVFPASVRIGGEEILAAPIRLVPILADGEGEWKNFSLFPVEKADDRAHFMAAAEADNVMVNAEVTAEEDGFVRVDFGVLPHWAMPWTKNAGQKARLRGLRLELPLKKKFASLMHYWPNCESAVCLSGRVLNSFAVPGEGIRLPFKPYVWFGTEELGLGVATESDENYLVDDENAVFDVSAEGETVLLRVTLLDRLPEDWQAHPEAWGDNLKMLTYSFSFQATPVKEFEKENLRSFRAYHNDFDTILAEGEKLGDKYAFLDEIAAAGANWVVFHERWSLIQNYGFPRDEEAFKACVRACHERGLKTMVYFGYEASTLMPGFFARKDEILCKNVTGASVGGWQRYPIQKDHIVCYAGSYGETMLERVRYAMDELGVDGIYTDGTYVPWECANPAHGCGWRDAAGRTHATYPVYAVREHVKKLYAEIRRRGGRSDTHQSSCCLMPTLSFCDSYYDGENIQGLIAEDPANLRPDVFRAEFLGRNLGISCNLISYTSEKFTIRMAAGISLIHNVLPRAGKPEDLRFMGRVWKIYDAFGADKAAWTDYFSPANEYAGAPEGLYVSYYDRDGERLCVLCSLNKNLTEARLPAKGFTEAEDCLDALPGCRIEGGELVIPMNYVDVKLVRLR